MFFWFDAVLQSMVRTNAAPCCTCSHENWGPEYSRPLFCQWSYVRRSDRSTASTLGTYYSA